MLPGLNLFQFEFNFEVEFKFERGTLCKEACLKSCPSISRCAPKPRRRRGNLIQGAPPVEQNPFLQDQTLGTTPSPAYNTFLLKQGGLR